MKKTRSNLLKGAAFALSGALMLTLSRTVSALADVDPNFLTKDNGNGTFSKVTSVVEQTGASLRTLIITVSVLVMFVGLAIIGMQLFGKNVAKREEAKSRLGWAIVGAILIFGGVAILSLSQSVANQLSTSISQGSNTVIVTPDPNLTATPVPTN